MYTTLMRCRIPVVHRSYICRIHVVYLSSPCLTHDIPLSYVLHVCNMYKTGGRRVCDWCTHTLRIPFVPRSYILYTPDRCTTDVQQGDDRGTTGIRQVYDTHEASYTCSIKVVYLPYTGRITVVPLSCALIQHYPV